MEGFEIQQNTNKYHRRSIRLRCYDYSESGWYFVTICTQNRELFFENLKIKNIVQRFWLEIPKCFKNVRLVRLDKWITMPNHIHGIIIIDNPVGARHGVPNGICGVSNEISIRQNEKDMPRPKKGVPRHAPTVTFGPLKRNSLSSIINHFKGNVKRWCNKNDLEYFQWQRGFYDHIIRNEKSLNDIRQYIITNPDRWTEDIENVKNNFTREQIKKYYDNLFTK